MKIKKIIIPVLAAMLIGNAAASAIPSATLNVDAAAKKTIVATKVDTSKVSSTKIKIKWSDSTDKNVSYYYIDKRENTKGKWRTIKTIKSDGKVNNNYHTYTDTLKSKAPQQYQYRIRVKLVNETKYSKKDVTVWGSNIKICIDPGHYKNVNNNYNEKGANGRYRYSESEAMLKIAKYMKECLENEGIDAYLTRTDQNIKLGGYTNLDNSAQLEARGKTAKSKNCDYFISLHTNANNQKANRSGTWDQKSSLNKTIVFINNTGKNNSKMKQISNRIGNYITNANNTLKIPTQKWATGTNYYANPENYPYDSSYTVYNDSLNKKGKLIYRSYNAYYAVLRAADQDKIPGILVEHSYHTVPAFRKAFIKNDTVAKAYGLANARAVAHGLGFTGTSTKYYESGTGYVAQK